MEDPQHAGGSRHSSHGIHDLSLPLFRPAVSSDWLPCSEIDQQLQLSSRLAYPKHHTYPVARLLHGLAAQLARIIFHDHVQFRSRLRLRSGAVDSGALIHTTICCLLKCRRTALATTLPFSVPIHGNFPAHTPASQHQPDGSHPHSRPSPLRLLDPDLAHPYPNPTVRPAPKNAARPRAKWNPHLWL